MEQAPREKYFVGLTIANAQGLLGSLTEPPPPWRLLHPDDVHLTVAFLGDVDSDAARSGFHAAKTTIARAFERDRTSPLFALADVTPFGGKRFEALSATFFQKGIGFLRLLLQETRDDAWRAAGSKRDSMGATPHVTVARRPGGDVSETELSAGRAWAAGQKLIDPFRLPQRYAVLFDGVALFVRDRSTPLRRYAVIDKQPLACANELLDDIVRGISPS